MCSLVFSSLLVLFWFSGGAITVVVGEYRIILYLKHEIEDF